MNSQFLYQYLVPPPPPYPHPVTKGVIGVHSPGESWAYRGFWILPFWQSEFGPGHQCGLDVIEASCKTLGRGSLRRRDLRGCCGVLKPTGSCR